MSHLLIREENNVVQITLNRPEALNALNAQLLNELSNALIQISEKPLSQVQALVITGAGDKSFVAGADIKEMSSMNSTQAQAFAQRGQGIFRLIEKLKIPALAAVNGFALGGGMELALACDFIYASENAKFSLPEVSLGLIPGFGGTVRLSRIVGLAAAKEMIFSAEMISANEALRIGLVNKVYPTQELMAQTIQRAQLISQRGPLAISLAKKSVMSSYDLSIDEAMSFEAQQFAALFSSQDVREGTQAFIEKRKANFIGA